MIAKWAWSPWHNLSTPSVTSSSLPVKTPGATGVANLILLCGKGNYLNDQDGEILHTHR